MLTPGGGRAAAPARSFTTNDFIQSGTGNKGKHAETDEPLGAVTSRSNTVSGLGRHFKKAHQ